MTDYQHLLEVAAEAAQIGGDVLLTNVARIPELEIDTKAEFDFVSEVDRQSEDAIVEHIQQHFPSHQILAEESGISGAEDGEIQWLIDPLDGTTNYIEGVPHFGVSIAARFKDEIVAGAVLDPVRQELFTACKGSGTFLNGERVQVSEVDNLHETLLGTGFPFRSKELLDSYQSMFHDFFLRVRDIRRMGVASIDLAYVACGRYDAFWEFRLSPWDVAAGIILVKEAGGQTSSFHPEESIWQTGNIIASNDRIHQLIYEIVSSHYRASSIQ